MKRPTRRKNKSWWQRTAREIVAAGINEQGRTMWNFLSVENRIIACAQHIVNAIILLDYSETRVTIQDVQDMAHEVGRLIEEQSA